MVQLKPAKVRSIVQQWAAGRATYWLGWLGLAVLIADRVRRWCLSAGRLLGGFLLGWLALGVLVVDRVSRWFRAFGMLSGSGMLSGFGALRAFGMLGGFGMFRTLRALGANGRAAWAAGGRECVLLGQALRKWARSFLGWQAKWRGGSRAAVAAWVAGVNRVGGWLGLREPGPDAAEAPVRRQRGKARRGSTGKKRRRRRRRGAERGAAERNQQSWGKGKRGKVMVEAKGGRVARWMGARRPGGGWRVAVGWATGVCAVAGVGVLLGAATLQPDRPPRPAPQAMPVQQGQGASLPRAVPARIEIPAIGVDASLLSLGLDGKDGLAVPPLDHAELASWYNLGPSPGEAGSAVIVGHVDSAKIGPAVFFNLGKLKPGDVITVSRKDGSRPEFKVDSVQTYLKTSFPTQLVYAGEQATLRLITCGGEFDKKTRNYLSNVVVFASLDT